MSRPLPARALVIAVAMATGWFGQVSSLRGEGPPEIDPTGGLRSRGVVPKRAPIGLTREELVRQWDLDGNGTIDPSEANVARARMRRARMESELETGIDPLTGKPRALADGVPEEPVADPVGLEIDRPESRTRSADTQAIPGTRVPDVSSVKGGSVGPRVPGDSSAGASATTRPAGARPSAASVASPDSRPGSLPGSRPGSLTGGLRAGAPAARSGYGTLAPKPDLNAGLPRPAGGRPVLSGTRGAARGGFLPSMRSPATPRPTPPPLLPTTPRVNADEIGGY